MKTVCLLTGEPGTGKTTIIREAVAGLKVKAGGFYTEEIRISGVRQGFRIVTLDGQDAILAHVTIPTSYRVSKYGVDIGNLEKVGVSALRQAIRDCHLIIIDEIGKMELFSSQFKEAVLEAINSGKKVLGTIMLTPNPFADELKHHPQVEVIPVTRTNREAVKGEVTDWLKAEHWKMR